MIIICVRYTDRQGITRQIRRLFTLCVRTWCRWAGQITSWLIWLRLIRFQLIALRQGRLTILVILSWSSTRRIISGWQRAARSQMGTAWPSPYRGTWLQGSQTLRHCQGIVPRLWFLGWTMGGSVEAQLTTWWRLFRSRVRTRKDYLILIITTTITRNRMQTSCSWTLKLPRRTYSQTPSRTTSWETTWT
jgi:hypothetical protein